MRFPCALFHGCSAQRQSYLSRLNRESLTAEILVHVVGHLDEGGEGGGLVVRPLIILDRVLEDCVVVGPTADVYDEVATAVSFVQVTCDVLNRVAICFLDEVGSWESHRDDSIRDVGEVQFLSFVAGEVFRACYDLLDDAEHGK